MSDFRPCPKPKPKLLDKRAIAAAKDREWWRVRTVVIKRDQGRCRVCGKPGQEVHHIVARSQGGKDVASNLVLLCAEDHRNHHGHVLRIYGFTKSGRLNWEKVK